MPKLTYNTRHPDDPEETKAHGIAFTKGKAVEVPSHVHEALKDNPWFRTDKGAAEEAEAAMSASVGDGRPVDSSIDVQYPPGSGMKTDPGALVKTSEGMVAADSDSAKNAENEVAKRGPGRPKKD